MRLLLILFLKLYICRLGYCDDACFNEPKTIYLLETNTNYELNGLFETNVLKIMSAKVESKNVDGMSLMEALDSIPSEEGTVAIHLNATDFSQHNYNEILQHNFKYAGKITNIKYREKGECYMISTENTAELNETADNLILTKCAERIGKQTKLVSTSIDQYPRLLDFVTNFGSNVWNTDHYDEDVEAENICKPMLIVVCQDHSSVNSPGMDYPSDEITTRYIMKRKIRIDTVYSCESYDFHKSKMVIAVLAPKPFVLKENLNITTIFYDQLEMDDKPKTRDMFGNYGVTLLKSNGKMKDVFLKIMQMMEWKRVAIISDDSPFSQTFEQELTALFEKENVIYTSKSCVDPHCNYTEALSTIMMAEPRIVIANVLEKNGKQFVSQASEWRKSVVWLVRDWSPNATEAVALKLGDVISITLGLARAEDPSHDSQCKNESCNLKKILSTIDELDIYPYRIPRFLQSKRSMMQYLKALLQEIDIIAYATWYRQNYGEIKTIATTRINLSQLTNINYVWQPEAPEIRSELSNCIFKSSVYLHPCKDIDVVLIMLVLTAVILIILGITYCSTTVQKKKCYFESGGPYSRMA